MKRVCCVIHCACFCAKVPNKKGILEKQMLVRELSYVKIKEGVTYEPRSYLFDLSTYKWENISSKDQSTIQFQTNKIHGLRFYPTPEEEAVPISDLHSTMEKIYKQCSVTGVAEYVAFVDSQAVEGILKSLKIPYVNLKPYSCPKFTELNTPRSSYTSKCGHHVSKHCPRAEVAAFRDWLKKCLDEGEFVMMEEDDEYGSEDDEDDNEDC